MAFKGAWHRADGSGGGGGGGGGSGDRRYPPSTDSFSSFALPPQGVPGNQMNLGSMNYQTNQNPMYSVMNPVRKKKTSLLIRKIYVFFFRVHQ